MDAVKPYVIGVDLGGTNTVFGIVNQRGEILFDDSIKTQAYDTAERFVEAGVACLKPLIEKAGGIENIKAMGIGAPNGNYYTNAIEFAPNLPWKGVVPLGEMFSKELGIPVALTNDANAADGRDDLRCSPWHEELHRDNAWHRRGIWYRSQWPAGIRS